MSRVVPSEVALDVRSHLGEGVCWDDALKCLYWVDILRGEIHRFDPASGKDVLLETGQPTGFARLTRKAGVLVAGMQHGIYTVDFDARAIAPAVDPEAEIENNRFNDAACDAAGRLWAGTMSNALNESADNPVAAGSVYKINPDFSYERVLENVYISNGIAFSAANDTMYYIDTLTQNVMAYDFDQKSGALSRGRVAVEIPLAHGSPDGMTIDEEDMIWVARWGGFGVSRYDPRTGNELQRIELPVPNVTCCAFGGKTLDELYISTSSIGADARQHPQAGALFVSRPGVRGVTPHRFGG